MTCEIAVCDHRSVGMLVFNGEDLLLVDRAQRAFGMACPAGHMDEDTDPQETARRELREETGLETRTMRLLLVQVLANDCSRVGGTWHRWHVFEISVADANRLAPDPGETRGAAWFSSAALAELATRTRAYEKGCVAEDEWRAHPGLEPVWLRLLTSVGVLS